MSLPAGSRRCPLDSAASSSSFRASAPSLSTSCWPESWFPRRSVRALLVGRPRHPSMASSLLLVRFGGVRYVDRNRALSRKNYKCTHVCASNEKSRGELHLFQTNRQ
ncbi:hypothetical protein Scep_002298 [Stephania cephalantha]|uniref:Uncharacterized protein n=1 Tax=Stephania cephalantha TaxID=152367 RepID=A0AAP0Q462_9MAGN